MSYSRRELYAMGEPLGNSATRKKVGGRVYGDGGDGGSPAPQNSTAYTTNLPQYAQPYYEELLKQTGKNVFNVDGSGTVTGVKGYNPYVGERIAGFTPEQTALQQQYAGLTNPNDFANASSALNNVRNLGGNIANQGYQQALAYRPQEFGAAQAQQYMSPYQQNVTDIALREANRQSAMAKKQNALTSMTSGAFGGGRNALMQSEILRNQAQNAADIQSKGSQAAYENAQKQFLADQQAKQFQATLGQNVGQAGLAAQQQAGTGLGALAAQQQQSVLERLKAQSTSAAEKQAIQQKIDDLQYQQAMEARDWEKKQLQYYSDLLRGNASALGSTQVQYTPQPSMLSQIGGLGLGALGLSKALG